MRLWTPETDRQRDTLADVLAHSFAVDAFAARGWLEMGGHDNVRVFGEPGDVVGGCMVLPMGQFFGGRSVPTVGIVGVAVRADRLRQGLATEMMRRVLREQRGAGFALSSLYASTEALYRRVGYEQAGGRYEGRCKASELPRGYRRVLPVTIVTEAHWPQIDALYARWAEAHPGHLDRPRYVWRRLRESSPRRGACHGLLVGPADAPRGYLFYRRAAGGGLGHTLQVQDLVAVDDAARETVMALINDLCTMADEVVVPTSPTDPFYGEPAHPAWELGFDCAFHLRVLDVKAAVEGRGYLPGLALSVDIELDDQDLPEQSGRWRIDVRAGRATVARGGSGAVGLGPRGLATVYSGHRSARQAAQLGLCAGADDALDALSAAFSGPAPWMREMF